MDTVGAIAVLILTPVLWILSHKFFRFIYFGNIGNSILKEILECFFISLLLVSVFGAVFGEVLSFLGSALLFVLKALLIIGAISLAIWLISVIVKKVKQQKEGIISSDNASSREEDLTKDCPSSQEDNKKLSGMETSTNILLENPISDTKEKHGNSPLDESESIIQSTPKRDFDENAIIAYMKEYAQKVRTSSNYSYAEKYSHYINDVTKTAIEFGVWDNELNILGKPDSLEYHWGYRLAFLCSFLEITIDSGIENISEMIKKSKDISFSEKSEITYKCLNKYHLIQGNLEKYDLSSAAKTATRRGTPLAKTKSVNAINRLILWLPDKARHEKKINNRR